MSLVQGIYTHSWQCSFECGVTHTGVEHLLRDVKDATVSTLAADVSTLATGLNGLRSRLLQIQEYLALVLDGKLPVNHDIMYQLQVAFVCESFTLPIMPCMAQAQLRCLQARL